MTATGAPLVIRGEAIGPPLFLAPMAGITHSAFRRLVAFFGGCGCLFTEMLSPAAVGVESLETSPFVKRRPEEGRVIYQLLLTGEEDFAALCGRLAACQPFGLDVNCGCPAPDIVRAGGGTALFEDHGRLRRALEGVRRQWGGILTVKCRLGERRDSWQEGFAERLRIIEGCGADALTVHPRFSDEKLKRRVRHELFPWIAAQARLPLIGNGDVTSPLQARSLLASGACRGIMIGRMAAVKPWIFREIGGASAAIDYREVWTRFFGYVTEDFRPEKAIGRLKEFTAYYARNFTYGHRLFSGVQSAGDLNTLRKRALEFLTSSPQTVKEPSVMGV